MQIEVVRLTPALLEQLPLPLGLDRRAYFTPGSEAWCLLADGKPVFAGGICNLQWNRGECWMLPTDWFKAHVKTCYREIRRWLPRMASRGDFVRVQATCIPTVQVNRFIQHLGFYHEATLAKFGPSGETCGLWSRIFEVTP